MTAVINVNKLKEKKAHSHTYYSLSASFSAFKLSKMSSSTPIIKILVIFMFVLPCLVCLSHAECEFKAIFNFGDSNSDTGGFFAAFPAQSGPFGMTYFNKPTGRASDGRLIVDFLGMVFNNLHHFCH